MLIRSKWVAEKECHFNYAINSLLAGTNSYQRADRIFFLTLMKYKHSDFNLQLRFLLWCSRGWKTLSLFFYFTWSLFAWKHSSVCIINSLVFYHVNFLWWSHYVYSISGRVVNSDWCLVSMFGCGREQPHANCWWATSRELYLMSAWDSLQARQIRC